MHGLTSVESLSRRFDAFHENHEGPGVNTLQLSPFYQQRVDNCILVVKRHLDNNNEYKAWHWYASMLKAFVRELGPDVPVTPFPGTGSLTETMSLLPQKLVKGTITAIIADCAVNPRSTDAINRYDSCLSLLQALVPDAAHQLPPFEEIVSVHQTPVQQEPAAPKRISDEKLARRLARVAADDIRVYNPDLIMQGIVEHSIFELLHEEIEVYRKEFNSRVTPEIAASNIFDFALVDVLINRAYKGRNTI